MMRSALQDERYGRSILMGGSILVWILLLILFKTYGYNETWQLWKVPLEKLPFSDFRLIPGSAESFLKGFEPSVENPFDPYKRIFNYPTFWRIFFYSGITLADTAWISIGMIILFFVGVFLFPGKLCAIDALGMLFILFSPALMLLYERANVDLIIFFVCAVTIVVGGYSSYLAAAGLVFGGIMKMFPFFGVGILLKEPKKRFLWLFTSCLVVFLAYFSLTFDSARNAWNTTMRGDELSYGSNVFFTRYESAALQFLSRWFADAEPLVKWGPITVAFLLILMTGITAMMQQKSLPSASERNLSAFRMGASVYMGTFLLGNNWDYRLAFLVFLIPQLFQWTRESFTYRRRFFVIMVLVLVFTSCWHFILWFSPALTDIKEVLFIIDELVNWLLAVALSYLFFLSSPDWLRRIFANIFKSGQHPPLQNVDL